MKQAPILILDAITAGLDNQAANEMMQCILTLNGRMTIFIISHNQKDLEHVDTRIFIEQGI